ncbi:MAG: 4Fe-4S binding protein [FCB group bacterium]|nr:4Fe-4S binding protein [FCB group bacterium]
MPSQKTIQFSGEAVRSGLGWLVMFLAIGFWRYAATGHGFFIWLFGYIGFSVAIGAFLSRALKRKLKPWGRRISQILIGLFMLGLLGFLGHENMQIEGFFFYLFAGVFSGASLHYFIAKLVGPFTFGRSWCGWACWTMMVMDLFPWKKPARGRIKYLGLLRYIHFAVSLALVSGFYYLADFSAAGERAAELEWLMVGNALYYLLAVVIAVALKDNRAFCKYICPVPVTMKALSRFSLLKQKVNLDDCNDCGLCEENCLMDIKLLEYARQNKRVLSTECILCDTCVNICPTGAIKSTWKFDIGWQELINMKSDDQPEELEREQSKAA